MGRATTRTRIKDLINDNKVSLGLSRVERYTPRSVASDWEVPILFVSVYNETMAYRQIEKQINRDQQFVLRVLVAEVGTGWTEDLEDTEDDLIDGLVELFVGNPNLRRNGDAGIDGVDTTRMSAARILTPFSFPGGQTTKQYHAFEIPLTVLFSQSCFY